MVRTGLRLLILGLALSGFLLPAQARAQAQDLLGEWQQIGSDAGRCGACRIVFSGGLPSLSVTSNNGWTAAVEPGETDGRSQAGGRGRWNDTAKPLGAMPFKVAFDLRDQRLYMTMVVEFPRGRPRTIRAVFGRVWFGA